VPGAVTSGPLLVTGIALIGVILPLASLASRLLSDREACFQHTQLYCHKNGSRTNTSTQNTNQAIFIGPAVNLIAAEYCLMLITLNNLNRCRNRTQTKSSWLSTWLSQLSRVVYEKMKTKQINNAKWRETNFFNQL
jgi:hypothetical protein